MDISIDNMIAEIKIHIIIIFDSCIVIKYLLIYKVFVHRVFTFHPTLWSEVEEKEIYLREKCYKRRDKGLLGLSYSIGKKEKILLSTCETKNRWRGYPSEILIGSFLPNAPSGQ